jgi:hypothetical protein
MVTNRFATEIVKETVSAIGTAGAAAADEMMTTAPEKDTMRATPTTIREANEGTDTSHPLLFTESQWVCWVGIVLSNFLQLYPFLAEGKILQQAVARPTRSRHLQQRLLQHHHQHYYLECCGQLTHCSMTRISEHAVLIRHSLRLTQVPLGQQPTLVLGICMVIEGQVFLQAQQCRAGLAFISSSFVW